MRRLILIGLLLLAGCSGGRRMIVSPKPRRGSSVPESSELGQPLMTRDYAHEPAVGIPGPERTDNRLATTKPTDVYKSATESTTAAPIVDSDMTLAQALDGTTAPDYVKDRQCLVDVRYYSFDHRIHQGQLLIDKSLADDVKSVFSDIEKSKFPIARVIPIEKYHWSDDASQADDNSSGFNFRPIPETHLLSHHALGRAIDINPLQNPYEDPRRNDDKAYDPTQSGTLTRSSPVTQAFLKHGWSWGGTWRRDRDYQHFEKLR